MEPHRDPSSFSSPQQLLEALESLISLESSRNGNPWMNIDRLSELFYEKYELSLEDVVQAQGCGNSLRDLFIGSRRFSVYGTQNPQDFYVALLQVVVSGCSKNQTNPIQYRIKRPWKVDGNLLRMLKAEGAEEISSQPAQSIEISSRPAQSTEKYQLILISEIKSVDDLKIVLVEIVKDLVTNSPKQFATVATLSRKFHEHYGQPIRTVTRRVCPHIRLLDLLQTIPNLHVREVGNHWQIKYLGIIQKQI